MSKDYISSSIIIYTTSISVFPLRDDTTPHPERSIRFIDPKSLLASPTPSTSSSSTVEPEEPPAGTVKSIIPCTPLAIVKCLEFVGVYNTILPYGDRAYGKTITVINRYVPILPGTIDCF